MPFSFLQVISWIIALFILAVFIVDAISLVMHAEDDNLYWVIPLSVAYAICFTLMVIQTALVTISDPSDPTTKLNRMHRESLKAANEGKADRVVIFNENKFEFYCEVCDTHVLRNSKHCQRCNRCTYEFDHHCLWVSNDIGLHNYASFIRMLAAVLFTILF